MISCSESWNRVLKNYFMFLNIKHVFDVGTWNLCSETQNHVSEHENIFWNLELACMFKYCLTAISGIGTCPEFKRMFTACTSDFKACNTKTPTGKQQCSDLPKRMLCTLELDGKLCFLCTLHKCSVHIVYWQRVKPLGVLLHHSKFST